MTGAMKNALTKEASREETQKNIVAELFFWDFAGQVCQSEFTVFLFLFRLLCSAVYRTPCI